MDSIAIHYSMPVNSKRNEISLYLTPRYILGLILILASFTSAYLISHASDKTIMVWAATVDLAPGEILTDSDLTKVRVRLLDNPEQYLSSNNSITGTSV